MSDNIIDLDELDYIQKRRRRINSISVDRAIFMRDGKVIEIPEKYRDDFDFTGLSTIDFYCSDFLPQSLWEGKP